MANYVTKEVRLTDMVLPEGVEILYSTWRITNEAGEEVHYTEKDEVNLTSKIFTDVFEVGKKYFVVMSLVRTDGPTINTKPLEVFVTSTEEVYNEFPLPSVIDTPIVYIGHDKTEIPINNITFTSSEISVAGNATHDYSNWWLTDDNNEVVWKSFNNQTNKREIKVSGVSLSKDTVYTMHVVYHGTNRDSSGAGSITFIPMAGSGVGETVLSEIVLEGDLDNTYYGMPINTEIDEIPGMSKVEYRLVGDGNILYNGSSTDGSIDIGQYGSTLGVVEVPFKFSSSSIDLGEYDYLHVYLATHQGKSYGLVARNISLVDYSAKDLSVCIVDLITGEVEIIPTKYTTRTREVNSFTHNIIVINGEVWFPCHSSGDHVIYNIESKEISYKTQVTTSTFPYTAYGEYAICMNNRYIVLVPRGQSKGLIIDTNDKSHKEYTISNAPTTSTQLNSHIAVAINENEFYVVPYGRYDYWNRVNLSTGVVSATIADAGEFKYTNAIRASNGKIYAASLWNSKAAVVDPSNNSIKYIALPDIGGDGMYQYQHGIARGDKIYFSGYKKTKILCIDSKTDTYKYIGTPNELFINRNGNQVYHNPMITMYNNILYVPYFSHGDRFSTAIIDLDDNIEYEPIDVDDELNAIAYGAYWTGDGSLYANSYTYINKITPAHSQGGSSTGPIEHEASINPLYTGVTEPVIWGSGVFNNKLIYGPSSGSSKTIRILDLESNEWTEVDPGITDTTDDVNYYHQNPIQAPNGKVYMMPSSCTYALVLDLEKLTVNRINFSGDTFKSSKWTQSIIAPNGKIYSIPNHHSSVICLDTNTNTFSTIADYEYSTFHSGGLCIAGEILYWWDIKNAVARALDSRTDNCYVVNGGSGVGISWIPIFIDNTVYFMSNVTASLYKIDQVSNPTNLIRVDNFIENLNDYITGIVHTDDYILLMDNKNDLGLVYDKELKYISTISLEGQKYNTTRSYEIGYSNPIWSHTENGSVSEFKGPYIEGGSTSEVVIPASVEVVGYDGDDGYTVSMEQADGTIRQFSVFATSTRIYDPKTKTITINDHKDNPSIPRDYYWNSAVKSKINGSTYIIPCKSGNILVFEESGGIQRTVSVSHLDHLSGLEGELYRWTSAVEAPNGKIYCMPDMQNIILVINPTESGETIEYLNLSDVDSMYNAFFSGILIGSKIYITPIHADYFIILDTDTEVMSTVSLGLGNIRYKYGTSVLANNGKIYCVPGSLSNILEINPVDNSFRFINVENSALENQFGWKASVLVGDEVWGLPDNENDIICYNYLTDSVRYQEMPGNKPFNVAAYGVRSTIDGKIYITSTTSPQMAVITMPSKMLVSATDSYKSYVQPKYEEYNLQIKVTLTNGTVIGWVDNFFYPKTWKIESSVWDDTEFIYENKVDVIDGTISNYKDDTITGNHNTISGRSYQLPNGEVIMLRGKYNIGRYSVNEATGVFNHLGDVSLPHVKLHEDYTTFSFKPFDTLDVLIAVGYIDYTIYHYVYNPLTNKYVYITEYEIIGGGSQIYSEMHLVDNTVVFITEGNTGLHQNLYRINLEEKELELLSVDPINNTINGNLYRLTKDKLLLRGGVSSSSNNSVMNNDGLELSIGSGYHADVYDISDIDNIYLGNGRSVYLSTVGKYAYTRCISGGAILKTNMDTMETISIGAVSADSTGTATHTTGTLANNKLYHFPYSADTVLIIDTTNDEVEEISISSLGLSSEGKYYDGVLAPNGKIYVPPFSTTTPILVVDSETNEISKIDRISSMGSSTYYCTAVLVDTKIYCVPYVITNTIGKNTAPMMIIDTELDTISTVEISFTGSLTTKYLWRTPRLIENTIYALPLPHDEGSQNTILKFNTVDNTYDFIPLELANGGIGREDAEFGVLEGDYIYVDVIDDGEVVFLKINHTNDEVEYVRTNISDTIASTPMHSEGKFQYLPWTYPDHLIDVDYNKLTYTKTPIPIANVTRIRTAAIYEDSLIGFHSNDGTKQIKLTKQDTSLVGTSTDRFEVLPASDAGNQSLMQATLRNNMVINTNLHELSSQTNNQTSMYLIPTKKSGRGGGFVSHPNGKLYTPPYHSTGMLIFDPKTNTERTVEDHVTGSGLFIGAVLAPNGYIYCIPHNSTRVWKFDPETETGEYIGTTYSGTFKWNNGVLAPNGKIYAMPENYDGVLVIDPETDTTSIIASGETGTTTSRCEFAVLHSDGKIYIAPYGVASIIILDPDTNTIEKISTSTYGYTDAISAPNGNIYFLPHGHNTTIPNTILVLKPDRSMYTIPVGKTPISASWIGSCITDNGIIYAAPYSETVILTVDTNTDTVKLIADSRLSGSSKWYGLTLHNDGKLYGCPSGATNILVIDPEGLEKTTFEFNLLNDTKEVLSKSESFVWKTVGGEQFKFTLHLNNGKRMFISTAKNKPKLLVYK